MPTTDREIEHDALLAVADAAETAYRALRDGAPDVPGEYGNPRALLTSILTTLAENLRAGNPALSAWPAHITRLTAILGRNRGRYALALTVAAGDLVMTPDPPTKHTLDVVDLVIDQMFDTAEQLAHGAQRREIVACWLDEQGRMR